MEATRQRSGASSYARTVMERCDALSHISEEPDRLTRRFATPAMRQVNELVTSWMREAGMTTRVDNIGNLIYNIMLLAFIIGGFMIVLGIAFGGFRVAMNRFFPGRVVNRPEDIDFIKLNLRE